MTAASVSANCTDLDSACAFELTRRVTGNVVAVHAGFAYVNALTELPCIKLCVSLGDASTLLIRVLSLSRTRRKADSRRQNNEASQLHNAFSGCRILGAPVLRRVNRFRYQSHAAVPSSGTIPSPRACFAMTDKLKSLCRLRT